MPGAVSVAWLTPPGRGALSVIGIWGAGAAALIDSLFDPRRGGMIADWLPGRLGPGSWRGREHSLPAAAVAPEEVVVVRGQWGWEVHCHGGGAAAAAILDDLGRAGARILPAAAWLTRRGATAAADAAALLPAVGGSSTAKILARQVAGELDAALARLEGFVAAGAIVAARQLADFLRRAGRVGLRLARPWRVVVAGQVNAGKSSLVNALAGHARSLVSPLPGTTRDVLETSIVVAGWDIILVDTAGLRDAENGSGAVGPTERAGIDRAVAAARTADLVVHVVDSPTCPPPPASTDGLTIWSKSDLHPQGATPEGVIATSVTTGAGIERLAAAIVARLVPESFEEGLLTGPVPFAPSHLEAIAAVLPGDGVAGSEPCSGQ